MSTQEIGSLIKSVNDMTATVASKMEQIDLKVDYFEKNAPTIVRAQASKTIFLSENGSDSNNGLTIDKPKRTMQAAINEGMVGGVLTIYLDSDFLLDSNVMFAANIIITSTSRFTQANGRRAKLTAKQMGSANHLFTDGSTGSIYYMCKMFGLNCAASMTIQGVDLIIPSVTNWLTLSPSFGIRRVISSRAAFVSFGNIDGVSHYNSFNLISSNLDLGDNAILVDGNYHVEPYQASIVRASLYNSVVAKGEGANVFGQNIWFRNGQFVSSTETHSTKRGD
jgi:hypothetical protein